MRTHKHLVAATAALIVSCSKGGNQTPGVTPPPSDRAVFTEAPRVDFLGVFQGPGDVIDLMTRMDGQAPEGASYLEATAAMTSTGWAGLYFEKGGAGGSETEDLSAYARGSLHFAIRSTLDVEIGIRSDNVRAGAETSKIMLRARGYARLDGTWENVSIPISEFQRLDPALRLEQMEVLFTAAVIAQRSGARTGTFAIDNVRWKLPP